MGLNLRGICEPLEIVTTIGIAERKLRIHRFIAKVAAKSGSNAGPCRAAARWAAMVRYILLPALPGHSLIVAWFCVRAANTLSKKKPATMR